jgi:hypothetical protein
MKKGGLFGVVFGLLLLAAVTFILLTNPYPQNITGMPTITGANVAPIGWTDGIWRSGTGPEGWLMGWTCDPDTYSTPLNVHVYIDGTASANYAGEVRANNTRADLAGVCNGNLNHGFAYWIPESLRDGNIHSIYTYAINSQSGTNPFLSGGVRYYRSTMTDSNVVLDGLVSYYTFDYGTNDSSGNGNNGVLAGNAAIAWGGSFSGSALKLNGGTDYMVAGPASSYDWGSNHVFTFSGWFNPDVMENYVGFVSKVNGSRSNWEYMTITHSNRKMGSWDPTDWHFSPASNQIAAGKWVYLTYAFNGTSMLYYLNGELLGSNPFSYTNQPGWQLLLGSWHANYPTKGLIDEVRIYNRELSQSEIRALYRGGNNDCDMDWGGIKYIGTHDIVGLKYYNPGIINDSRFICFKNKFYECGWEYNNPAFAIKMADKQPVGSYMCDLAHGYWLKIRPTVTRSVASGCTYGSNCGPFGFISDAPGNFDYEFRWIYNFNNGSSQTYCATLAGNPAYCTIPIASQGSRTVYATNPGNNEYTLSQVISSDSDQMVGNVSLKAYTVFGGSKTPATTITIPIIYNCSTAQERCNIAGDKRCVTGSPQNYQVCGKWNASSACLVWGASTSCGARICSGAGECVTSSSTDTCTNAGGICLGSQPNNSSEVTSATCLVSSYKCYKCDTAAGYSWSSTTSTCFKPCTNTCVSWGGVCMNGSQILTNAVENQTAACCGSSTSKCWKCNSDAHSYDNSCVSNTCTGMTPDNSAGMTKGVNSTTIGASTWQYSLTATVSTPCQWKCNDGYHKVNNGCVQGWGPCSDYGGNCSAQTSVANGVAINGTCSAGETCYRCGLNSAWNGNTCYTCTPTCTGINQKCSVSTSPITNAGTNGTGVCCSGMTCYQCDANSYLDSTNNVCISLGSCSGCMSGNDCLSLGYRLTTVGGRFYCSSAHNITIQKTDNSSCASSYECQSNYCGNSTCVNIVTELRNQQTTMKRLLCTLRRIFFGENEAACLNS